MRKMIIILTLIIASSISYYLYYLQSDKKLLENFARELVDDSVKPEDLISKHVIHTEKGKKIALYLLDFIKEEYKKNPGKIIVSTREEAKRNKFDNQIEIKNTEKLYYIKFNENMIFPFLLNKESKIIVLFILIKGDGGFLANTRSDE